MNSLPAAVSDSRQTQLTTDNDLLTAGQMSDSLYIAVDLGAGSGRVFLGGMAPGELLLEEVRRFHYPPSESEGHIRWNLAEILDQVKAGLKDASERARQLGRNIRSIGVDSWAVDYGLINLDGELIEQPICYRDKRTSATMEEVFPRLPREEIFKRTGIQFQVFNTLFQLHAHAQSGIPKTAAKLLLIPDLINFFLTGRAVTEYTNATTTQMVNAESGDWDNEILESLGLLSHLLTEIIAAGADIGSIKPALADEIKLDGVRVIAPATHDTASAVAGTPLQDGWAYISSGTWSLVGVERDSTLINSQVMRQNFTNEGGAFGTVRFLKNVMGLWILESCRKEWKASGLDIDYEELLAQVGTMEDGGPLMFADDPRFLNPPSMLEAIAQQLAERGDKVPSAPAAIARMILDSLALRYASVLHSIEMLTNQEIVGVQIVGGGSKNNYLNQATANAARVPVLAGPVEATVIGNLMVQAIASGCFESLAEGRRHVANNIQLEEFVPTVSSAWDLAGRRYTEFEAGMVLTSA